MVRSATALIFLCALLCGMSTAQASRTADFDINDIPCCQYGPYEAIVWSGTDSLMTIEVGGGTC